MKMSNTLNRGQKLTAIWSTAAGLVEVQAPQLNISFDFEADLQLKSGSPDSVISIVDKEDKEDVWEVRYNNPKLSSGNVMQVDINKETGIFIIGTLRQLVLVNGKETSQAICETTDEGKRALNRISDLIAIAHSGNTNQVQLDMRFQTPAAF